METRLASPSLRFSRQYWVRLGIFTCLVLIAAAIVVLIGLSHLHAQALLHPERSPVWTTPEAAGINNYQPVSFQSSDGITLNGWFIPPENGAVIIFAHGFGANRIGSLDDAQMVVSHGYGALLFDLRNSGESDGDLTTMGLLEAKDVIAAVEYVQGQLETRPKVALFGHSMGAAAVLLAGQQAGADAIVSASAFTSLEDSISHSFEAMTGLPPFPFAPMVVFFAEREAGRDVSEISPVSAVRQYESLPVLFIHGDRDGLIPVSNVYELYEQANDPKEILVLEGAGHGGFRAAAPDEYERRIIGFLDDHLQSR